MLNGDSMLELRKIWAFHHGHTLIYLNMTKDSVWGRWPQKRQNETCWNGLNFNDNDALIVKEMSLLAVLLAYARTGIYCCLVLLAWRYAENYLQLKRLSYSRNSNIVCVYYLLQYRYVQYQELQNVQDRSSFYGEWHRLFSSARYWILELYVTELISFTANF